jgi:hypothetical protein
MFAPSVIQGLQLLTATMEALLVPINAINFVGDEATKIGKESQKQNIIKMGKLRREELNKGLSPEQIAENEIKQSYFISNPTEYKKKAINDIKALSKNNPQSISSKGGGVTITQNNNFAGSSATPAQQKQTEI